MYPFLTSQVQTRIKTQLLDLLEAQQDASPFAFAPYQNILAASPTRHNHHRSALEEKLCYDCAWMHETKEKRKQGLKKLFKTIAHVCSRISKLSKQEIIESELEYTLQDLELILVFSSQLSTLVSFPDMIYLKYVLSVEKWVDELMDAGFAKALKGMLSLNQNIPDSFLSKNRNYVRCIPYFACNIIATIIQLKVPQHLMGREDENTVKLKKQFIDEKVHIELTHLCSPVESGPLENIKAMAALRRLIDSPCVLDLVDDTDIMASCETILKDSKAVVTAAYRKHFKDYELVLLSLGINDVGVRSVQPLSLNQTQAYQRCLKRCGALETNASAILSEIAEHDNCLRTRVEHRKLLELTIGVLTEPTDTEYILNEHFPSSVKVLAAWVKDAEGIATLKKKADLRAILHLASTHGDSFNKALFFQQLSQIILYGGEEIISLILSSKYAVVSLMTSLESPMQLLRESGSCSLAEMARYKSGAVEIAKWCSRSYIEHMVRQMSNTEWTAHNLLRMTRSVLKHVPDWREEKIDWNAAEAKERKVKGNRCFQQGQYKKAIKHYSTGAKHVPYTLNSNLELESILYANWSECLLRLADAAEKAKKTQEHIDLLSEAAVQGTRALSLNNNNNKAFFRRGKAFTGLKRYYEALNDFYSIKINSPNTNVDSNIKKLWKKVTCVECQKRTQKIFICGKCKAARYCSAECQRKHWDTHIRECG